MPKVTFFKDDVCNFYFFLMNSSCKRTTQTGSWQTAVGTLLTIMTCSDALRMLGFKRSWK